MIGGDWLLPGSNPQASMEETEETLEWWTRSSPERRLGDPDYKKARETVTVTCLPIPANRNK